MKRLAVVLTLLFGASSFAGPKPIDQFPLEVRQVIESIRSVTEFLNGLNFTTENSGPGNPFIARTATYRYPSQAEIDSALFHLRYIEQAFVQVLRFPEAQIELLRLKETQANAELKRRMNLRRLPFDPNSPIDPIGIKVRDLVTRLIHSDRTITFKVQKEMVDIIERLTQRDDRSATAELLIMDLAVLANNDRLHRHIRPYIRSEVQDSKVAEKILAGLEPPMPVHKMKTREKHPAEDFMEVLRDNSSSKSCEKIVKS